MLDSPMVHITSQRGGAWVILSAAAPSVLCHVETHRVVNVISGHTSCIIISICLGLHWPHWVFHTDPRQWWDGGSVESTLSLTRFETITLRAKAQYGFAAWCTGDKNIESDRRKLLLDKNERQVPWRMKALIPLLSAHLAKIIIPLSYLMFKKS